MMIFQVKYYSYKLVHCHGEKVENDNILFDIFVGIWYKSNLASQNRPIIQWKKGLDTILSNTPDIQIYMFMYLINLTKSQ
jgi:hypothetical protein